MFAQLIIVATEKMLDNFMDEFLPSSEISLVRSSGVRSLLGEVRLLAVTDRQFGKMEIFFGRNRTEVERPPEEYLLF